MLNCQRVCVYIYIYKRVLSIIYHAMIMIMVYVGKTSWDVMVRFLGQNADGKKWWCDGDIIEKSHDLSGYGGMKTIKHMEINVSTIVTWIYLIIIWEYSGIKQKRKNTQVHNIYWEHSRCFFSDTFITFVSGELHDLQIARGYISNFDNIHFCFCQTAREKSPTDYAVNRWILNGKTILIVLLTPWRESHERILILGCIINFGPTIASNYWSDFLLIHGDGFSLTCPFWGMVLCQPKKLP